MLLQQAARNCYCTAHIQDYNYWKPPRSPLPLLQFIHLHFVTATLRTNTAKKKKKNGSCKYAAPLFLQKLQSSSGESDLPAVGRRQDRYCLKQKSNSGEVRHLNTSTSLCIHSCLLLPQRNHLYLVSTHSLIYIGSNSVSFNFNDFYTADGRSRHQTRNN